MNPSTVQCQSRLIICRMLPRQTSSSRYKSCPNGLPQASEPSVCSLWRLQSLDEEQGVISTLLLAGETATTILTTVASVGWVNDEAISLQLARRLQPHPGEARTVGPPRTRSVRATSIGDSTSHFALDFELAVFIAPMNNRLVHICKALPHSILTSSGSSIWFRITTSAAWSTSSDPMHAILPSSAISGRMEMRSARNRCRIGTVLCTMVSGDHMTEEASYDIHLHVPATLFPRHYYTRPMGLMTAHFRRLLIRENVCNKVPRHWMLVSKRAQP